MNIKIYEVYYKVYTRLYTSCAVSFISLSDSDGGGIEMGENEEKIAYAIDKSLATADTKYESVVWPAQAYVVVIPCVQSMRS